MPRMARISFIMPLISTAALSLALATAALTMAAIWLASMAGAAFGCGAAGAAAVRRSGDLGGQRRMRGDHAALRLLRQAGRLGGDRRRHVRQFVFKARFDAAGWHGRVAPRSSDGAGSAIGECGAGMASEAASSLARARISTTPSDWRLDRITASGPSDSRTLRSASREVDAVNFLTFMTVSQGKQMEQLHSHACIIDDAPWKRSDEQEWKWAVIQSRKTSSSVRASTNFKAHYEIRR
jgi:hypothetical protein